MEHNLFNPDKHILLNGRILVHIPKLEEKTQGGIYLGGTLQKEQKAVIKGTLISFNEYAFADKIMQADGSYKMTEWEQKPEIGDTIFFYPYSGNVYFADDEEIYRNMSSKDLTGFEKKEE